MLINSPIPSLIGGVSQQPANLRHPTQVDAMLNCVPSIAHGVGKRAGFQYVATLSSADHSDSYVFGIDRGTDVSERYVVVVSNAGIRVFDWNGVEQSVSTPAGVGYLGASVPRTSFAHVTVADHTIITNRLVSVEKAGLASATVVPALFVVVKVGVVDSSYYVTLGGTTYTYSIGNSAGVNQTTAIAEGLRVQINAGGAYTATRTENRLKIVKNDGAAFSWSVADTYGDQALFGFRDTVQRFEELPRKFEENVVIRVIGDPDTKNDGWYVKWEKRDSSADGVWVETRANNIYTQLDASTMPHILRREASGTWVFEPAPWDARTVGDDESAPMPSLLGKTVSKVFFFRNRLGFLSDENIVLSQVDKYFNFFPTSARAVLDSDPIDVSAGSASAKINFLRHCLTFNKAMFVSSDGQQYQFGGQETLTPKNARLEPTTAYEIATQCAPVALGSNVLFPTKRGAYTSIREYYFDPDSTGNDALDVTAHVPTYVPGAVVQMSAMPALDAVFVVSESFRTEISAYSSFWNGQEKVQSAWHRWSVAGNPKVVSLMPFNTTLVAALQYPSGLFLVRAELDHRQVSDAPLLWPIHLDRRFSSTSGVYNPAGAGSTTWTTPYAPATAMQAVVLDKTGEVGQVLDLITHSPTVVGCAGDYSGCTVVIGERYGAAVTLSKLFVRDRDGRPILDSKLQLRDLSLNFTSTGYFEVAIYPGGRASYTYPYVGRTLGVSGSVVGQRTMQSGEFRCPIMANSNEVNIVVSSTQPLPFNLQAGQYSGVLATKSRRA